MNLTASLLEFAIGFIDRIGYLGITIILIVDNCGVPIPSEAVLALAGSQARVGKFNFWIVILLGAFAQTVGAGLAYAIGKYGGGPLVKKYGKYLLISAHDYEKAEAWFKKRGSKAIFISRLTPVIRTFISFPAGTFGMDVRVFLRDTFLGSLVWSVVFVSLGYALGESWRDYYEYLHYVDYLVLLAVVLFLVRFVGRKMNSKKDTK